MIQTHTHTLCFLLHSFLLSAHPARGVLLARPAELDSIHHHRSTHRFSWPSLFLLCLALAAAIRIPSMRPLLQLVLAAALSCGALADPIHPLLPEYVEFEPLRIPAQIILSNTTDEQVWLLQEPARDYFWRAGMLDNYSVLSTLQEQVSYTTFGKVFGPFTINSNTSKELKDFAFNATNCSTVYTTPITIHIKPYVGGDCGLTSEGCGGLPQPPSEIGWRCSSMVACPWHVSTATHESFHIFGFGHAGTSIKEGNGTRMGEYGDETSFMGGDYMRWHSLGAFETLIWGFFPANRVADPQIPIPAPRSSREIHRHDFAGRGNGINVTIASMDDTNATADLPFVLRINAYGNTSVVCHHVNDTQRVVWSMPAPGDALEESVEQSRVPLSTPPINFNNTNSFVVALRSIVEYNKFARNVDAREETAKFIGVNIQRDRIPHGHGVGIHIATLNTTGSNITFVFDDLDYNITMTLLRWNNFTAEVHLEAV